nr:immunoglobulin heavy chain junction region [Mus musculus]MBK4195603.1 immunoglobulin heavy chain junction region [Mus musculus]MBK4195608.1 immunoglobulin heavy chain junction region [Mus musculus]
CARDGYYEAWFTYW